LGLVLSLTWNFSAIGGSLESASRDTSLIDVLGRSERAEVRFIREVADGSLVEPLKIAPTPRSMTKRTISTTPQNDKNARLHNHLSPFSVLPTGIMVCPSKNAFVLLMRRTRKHKVEGKAQVSSSCQNTTESRGDLYRYIGAFQVNGKWGSSRLLSLVARLACTLSVEDWQLC